MKLLLLMVLSWLLPAHVVAFEVMAVRDAEGALTGELRAVDDAGEQLWSVYHRSMTRNTAFHGPLLRKETWVYGLGGDVLELSAEGKVVKRTPYPASIMGLRVEGETLWVTLEDPQGPGLEVLHTGQTPGRGPWSSFPKAVVRLDRDLPKGIPDKDGTGQDWASIQPKIQALEETDLTNPLLSAFLGLSYAKQGESERAGEAFGRAQARSLSWSDDLMICGVMEEAGYIEVAQKACARAAERQIEAGIRPEAMWNLVVMVATTAELRRVMDEAILRKDTIQANRIAGYFYTMFPNAEGSPKAWSMFSLWLAEQGDSANASKWSKISDTIESHPFHKAQHGQTRVIDLALLFMGSSGLAIVCAGFAFGVASYRRRPGGEGWRRVFCPPTVAESVSVGLFVLLTMWVGVEASRGVAQIGDFASIPLSALSDGLGSPDTIAWLETSPESPLKQKFLDFAQHEIEAMRTGQKNELAPPSPQEFVRLVEERASDRAGYDPLALFDLADFTKATAPTSSTPNLLFMFFGALPGFLIFGIAGRLVASRIAGPSRYILASIPGVFTGPFAVWVSACIVAGAVYLLTPIGALLHNIAVPNFERYYGLGSLVSEHNLRPDLNLILFIFGLGLAAHIFTVRRSVQL